MKQRFVLLVIAVIALLLTAAFTSCTTRNTEMTKVVILDSYDDLEVIEGQYMYRVNVISYGVTESIADWKLHECGDTILVHDTWRKYDIK